MSKHSILTKIIVISIFFFFLLIYSLKYMIDNEIKMQQLERAHV